MTSNPEIVINLKGLKWYYLNTEKRTDRKEHIEEILTKYDLSFTRIQGQAMTNKYTSGALGMANIVETHLKTGNFTPFVILEDDVSWSENLDETWLSLKVPTDADAIHLGISNAFCLPYVKECGGPALKQRHPTLRHLFRIYNMLSLHSVLILTEKYARAFYQSMIQAATVGYCWDTFSCRLQVNFEIYALEKPLMFQDSKLGGQESETKIDWTKDGSTVGSSFDPKRYYITR